MILFIATICNNGTLIYDPASMVVIGRYPNNTGIVACSAGMECGVFKFNNYDSTFDYTGKFFDLGTVHKRRPQSGKRKGLSGADKGVLRMRSSASPFGAKYFGFFEIYGVPAQTRGVEPVRSHFSEKGGVNYSIRDFVRTSSMDGPLCLLVL